MRNSKGNRRKRYVDTIFELLNLVVSFLLAKRGK